MTSVQQLITENIDLWTSAIAAKSASGRGTSSKRELYGIKKLRELILELAVRGKLVPQDPNDEPASVLLERIAAEKAQLVKEKKLKKPKALPAINEDEKSFELPRGWEWSRFGDVTFNRDAERVPLSTGDRSKRQGEYDYYGASGVIDSIDDYLFDQPLLLIGEDGANLINRSTPIAFMAYGKYWVNNHAHVLDGITEQFLLFLCMHINAISLEPYITGTAQPKMNQAKMNTILLGIPPEAEQHRIVAKVDELMTLCDQLEQQTESRLDAHAVLVDTLLATLTNSADADELATNWSRIADHFDTLFTTEQSIDALKQAVLQLAVMGKLVPQDPNDEPAAQLLERIAAEKAELVKQKKIKKPKPPISFEGLDTLKERQLPVNWCWTRLSDISDVVRGGSPRPAGDPKFYDGDIPFLKVADVTGKSGKLVEGFKHTIKEAGLTKTRFVDTRTVLFSNSGATLGVPAICDFPATFNDGIAAFLELSSHVYDEYLYLYLGSMSKWFLEVASRGQGQPNLNTDIIKSTWFPCPPLGEQHLIVAKVDQLMALCDQLKQRLSQAQQTQLHLADAMVEKALN